MLPLVAVWACPMCRKRTVKRQARARAPKTRPAVVGAAPGPPRILLVDDEPDILHAFQALLATRLQADVQVAASGVGALAALERRAFDLIVADQRMPNMSGLELIAKAKARFPSLPCVLFTAYGADSLESRAHASGVSLVLSKSVPTAVFTQRIQHVLAG